MFAAVVRPPRTASAAQPAASSRVDAFAARERLRSLRDDLNVAKIATRRRWNVPPLFFFNPERQTELEADRQAALPPESPLAERIAREIESLCESVEVRQMARALPGFWDAVQRHPAACPLAVLLAVPDRETVLVLHPERRLGVRVAVTGVVTIHQFQTLFLDAAAEAIDESRPASRFRAACGDANPVIPAGVPMTIRLPFQCHRPEAMRPDGTLVHGFCGSGHWLWGWEPLAAAPRVDGERTILLGEPVFPQIWEVERRFPAMAAETELLDVLNPFQVAERLGRLAGRPVPVRREPARREALAAAA